MNTGDVRRQAFAMPLTNPSYPPGPYRFYDREYLVITYETCADALRAVVPEPLTVDRPLVNYEFIRMPDSTGFGSYTESGQVIPVAFCGEPGLFVHSMYVDSEAPIAGGRELWGFPKKLTRPKLCREADVLVGTLHHGSVLCAVGTMGYKHRRLENRDVLASLARPNYL
jgi:acetoacetate decarboxylase